MADVFRRGAEDLLVGDAAQLDSIVGDETVAALDQLDGGLAFADAGIAQNKDAFAVDFHQHAVAGDAGSQLFIQRGDEHAHQGGGHLGRHKQRHAVLLGELHHLRKRLHAAGQDDGWRLEREQLFQMGVAQRSGQFFQIGHLGQADDLDALVIKIFVVTGQQDARTVHFGRGDHDLFQFAGGIGDGQIGFFRQFCQRNRELRHAGTPLSILPFCRARLRQSGTHTYFVLYRTSRFLYRGLCRVL